MKLIVDVLIRHGHDLGEDSKDALASASGMVEQMFTRGIADPWSKEIIRNDAGDVIGYLSVDLSGGSHE